MPSKKKAAAKKSKAEAQPLAPAAKKSKAAPKTAAPAKKPKAPKRKAEAEAAQAPSARKPKAATKKPAASEKPKLREDKGKAKLRDLKLIEVLVVAAKAAIGDGDKSAPVLAKKINQILHEERGEKVFDQKPRARGYYWSGYFSSAGKLVL